MLAGNIELAFTDFTHPYIGNLTQWQAKFEKSIVTLFI